MPRNNNSLIHLNLTDGIFETGAYGVPSKSQNYTISGQGGPTLARTDLLYLLNWGSQWTMVSYLKK